MFIGFFFITERKTIEKFQIKKNVFEIGAVLVAYFFFF